jgi:hypothetical protein
MRLKESGRKIFPNRGLFVLIKLCRELRRHCLDFNLK